MNITGNFKTEYKFELLATTGYHTIGVIRRDLTDEFRICD